MEGLGLEESLVDLLHDLQSDWVDLSPAHGIMGGLGLEGTLIDHVLRK